MAKFCYNCGKELAGNEKFCGHCGARQETETGAANSGLPEETPPVVKNETTGDLSNQDSGTSEKKGSLPRQEFDFGKINKNLKVKNSQSRIVRGSLMVTMGAVILILLTIREDSPLHNMFALTLIGILIGLTGLVTAWIFGLRAKKLATLISGENVVAAWQLSDAEKSAYAGYLYSFERSKNLGILGITTFLIVVIFGLFILFIDEGKGAMALVALGLILLLALFALGMPVYYRQRNLGGDGIILIGRKFAYVNGFFHNWDFPLSGIQKVKPIEEPFHGLYLQYYYYDRTLKNTEELHIPAPPETDLRELARVLKPQGTSGRK